MDEAARLLDAAPESKLELVIISDFQRGNWGSLFLDRIPEGARVQLEAVGENKAGNIAITAVRFPKQPVMGKECVIEVEVANHADDAAEVRCRVDLGSWQQTLEGRIAARTSNVLSGTFSVASSGWLSGWARLDANADALPADDVRPIAVLPLKSGSSFYLEQALRLVASPAEDNKLADKSEASTIQRIQPQRVDLAAWPAADLFVLNQMD
jgi:hypothetical protein